MARIAAIFSHPDDETAFAGGTLARYASEGNDVTLISVTKGEGGEAGDPPMCSRDDLGVTREAEMRRAAEVLGAREVIFLGFVDPRIDVGQPGRPIDASLDEFVAAVRGAIDRVRPDIVLTHGSGGEYGHPQHIFTHQAVLAASRDSSGWQPSEVLTWCANHEAVKDDRFTNKDDPADLVLDVTPWVETKCAALECHATQLSMIRRNNPGIVDIREMVRRTESFHRWSVVLSSNLDQEDSDP